MNKEIVEEICEWCNIIKRRMNIPDKIIRDDVFELLQKSNCTVLYYPLPDEVGEGDDGCAGCHVEKVIGDRLEQFVFINTIKEFHYNGHSVSVEQLLEISAYLMYYFFVPFKSVIRRYHELHRLTDEDRDILLKHNNSERLHEIIKAKQYTRLLIVNNEKSMDNLQEILIKAEKADILDGNLVRKMREEFDLKNIEEGTNVTVKF